MAQDGYAMRMGRAVGPLMLATALTACGGRIVPPATDAAPVGRPARPAMVAFSTAQVIPSGRAFDGGIVAATPLLAAPLPAGAPAGAATAVEAGLSPGPAIATLPITDAQAEAARAAFALSCPGLLRRSDGSGMTRGADWQPACAAAAAARGRARAFFADYFEAVQVGDGRALATGYYEPEIAASLERRPGYDVPIYARPDDLVDVDLGQFAADLKGRKIRGRVQGRSFVPYYDRAAIVGGALADKAPVLAWGADEAAVFFLQIQGSGRLRLVDGRTMEIGYDTQNGRDYTGIGKLMRDRGLLQPGQTSMQGIVAWLHANPDQARSIMNENRSFVFFRALSTPPLGAMGYVVNGGVSAAADVKFVPQGAPVFLSVDRADASGLWIVQDTGGAIKGSNRFDTYWGAGRAAEATAGGMAARGTAFVLLPTGTLARLTGNAPAQP